MIANPEQILPSQNFLKPDTIRFILECYEKNDLASIPPAPIVRRDKDGNLIASDGHNLIAVKIFRNESIRIHIAAHAEDALPEISIANKARNRDLKDRFDTVLEDRARLVEDGIVTFYDLTAKYPELLAEGYLSS